MSGVGEPGHESTAAARTDWTGRRLRLEVGGPAQGGEFVARHEGRVVFVRGGITGETVTAEVNDDPGRRFCRARVVEIHECSEHRVEPACQAAAAGAGCCDWAHIAADAARDFKARVLAEQLERVGGLTVAQPVEVVAPGGNAAVTGWRSVARLVTDSAGRPGVRGLRSHDVVTTPCAQLAPEIVAAVGARTWRADHEILAVLDDGGSVHLATRPVAGRGRRARGRSGRARGRGSASARRAAVEAGPPWQRPDGEGVTAPVLRRVGDVTWNLPLEAFWQAHRDAAPHYSDMVSEELGPRAPRQVWDLYGGAGLFTAAARRASPGAHVTLVESSPAGTTAARQTFGDGVDVVRSRTLDFLNSERAHHGGEGADRKLDAIVLDPPRGGAELEVMRQLADSGAGIVIHVGCDPASLARDVGALHTAGWSVRSVSGVDAFPGTHHVEGFAVVVNGASARRPAGRS